MDIEGHVTSIITAGRTFAEWTAEFDCEPARANELAALVGQGVFQGGFDALKRSLGRR